MKSKDIEDAVDQGLRIGHELQKVLLEETEAILHSESPKTTRAYVRSHQAVAEGETPRGPVPRPKGGQVLPMPDKGQAAALGARLRPGESAAIGSPQRYARFLEKPKAVSKQAPQGVYGLASQALHLNKESFLAEAKRRAGK